MTINEKIQIVKDQIGDLTENEEIIATNMFKIVPKNIFEGSYSPTYVVRYLNMYREQNKNE